LKVTVKYCVWARKEVRRPSDDKFIHAAGDIIEMANIYNLVYTEESAKRVANIIHNQHKHQKLCIWIVKAEMNWLQRGAVIDKFDNSNEVSTKRKKQRSIRRAH